MAAWGPSIADSLTLSRPIDIALSSDGRVYVADFDRDRIFMFNEEGRYMGAVGRHGDAAGELDVPVSAVWAGGVLHVADPAHRRVVQLRWRR